MRYLVNQMSSKSRCKQVCKEAKRKRKTRRWASNEIQLSDVLVVIVDVVVVVDKPEAGQLSVVVVLSTGRSVRR